MGAESVSLQFFRSIAGKPSEPAAAVGLISLMAVMISASEKEIVCRQRSGSDSDIFGCCSGKLSASIGVLNTVAYCLDSNSAICLLLFVRVLYSFRSGPMLVLTLDFFFAYEKKNFDSDKSLVDSSPPVCE